MKLTPSTASMHHISPRFAILGLTVFGLLLAGCKNETAAVAAPEPVKIVKVGQARNAGSGDALSLAAEIRPRIETKLAFRVPGRITQRQVEIGQVVAKGSVLARLDPQDYQLSVAAARSVQTAAEVDAKQAESDLKRQEDLQRKGFVSEAALEQRRSVAAAAQARVAQARAQAGSQGNQVSYTQLTASEAGVVVGMDAEIGQVVAAGQTVIRVARLGEKDAVASIPESQVEQVRKSQSVVVTSSAVPGKQFTGQVREISPLADPATRTFTVKISLSDAAALQLGMSAQVQFGSPDSSLVSEGVLIPLAALVNAKGATVVWVVEGDRIVERAVSVSTSASANDVLVRGLKAGETFVAAGGHLLAKGDKVKAWVSK